MTALLDTLLLCAVDSADGSERQRATNGRYVRDCRTTERWHVPPASAAAERRQQTVESHESSIESVQLSNYRQQRQQGGYRVFTRPRKTNVASLRYYVIRSWSIHVWHVACVSCMYVYTLMLVVLLNTRTFYSVNVGLPAYGRRSELNDASISLRVVRWRHLWAAPPGGTCGGTTYPALLHPVPRRGYKYNEIHIRLQHLEIINWIYFEDG